MSKLGVLSVKALSTTDDAYAQLRDVYALLPCRLVCLIGFSLCFCNCPLTRCFHLLCSVMREIRFCPRLISERDGILHLSPLSPGLCVTCNKYYLILLKLKLNWNYPWRLPIRMVGSDACVCWWDGFLGILGRAES